MSAGTGRRYPLTIARGLFRVARSTVYWSRNRALKGLGLELQKQGPKIALSNEELVEEIRAVLRESPFLGQGHPKVRARLRAKGIRVGKGQVLRWMRENALLAPVR